jgi:hypothetical protein
MKFIKPKAVYEFDVINDDPFKDLIGIKIFDKNSYHPKEFHTDESLRIRYKEFEKYAFSHRYDVIGKLISSTGKVIRDIQLLECVNKLRGYEEYINETTFTRPSREVVRYSLYKGLKFKMKDNHLSQWFSRDETQQFNAPVPQQLGEKGYIVMVEDLKNHVVVNYGTDLIQQEMKEVYCSVNGRYIKYKGKNHYIKEN